MNMLENKVAPIATKKGTMAGFIIGLAIGVVILFALLPTVNAGISDASLSGANATLAQLVVTMLILVPIAAVGTTLA